MNKEAVYKSFEELTPTAEQKARMRSKLEQALQQTPVVSLEAKRTLKNKTKNKNMYRGWMGLVATLVVAIGIGTSIQLPKAPSQQAPSEFPPVQSSPITGDLTTQGGLSLGERLQESGTLSITGISVDESTLDLVAIRRYLEAAVAYNEETTQELKMLDYTTTKQIVFHYEMDNGTLMIEAYPEINVMRVDEVYYNIPDPLYHLMLDWMN